MCACMYVQDGRQKVMVSLGIDSTAFFHDLAFGANDAVASIAAVLAAIEALGKSGLDTLTKQPMFLFANGEEWGYSGSRRFMEDVNSFQCENAVKDSNASTGLPLCTSPVYPSTLFQRISNAYIHPFSEVMAIDLIGNWRSGVLFAHSLSESSSAKETIMALNGDEVLSATISGVLPPSPLTSILATYPDLADHAVLLAGYNSYFNDSFYHSRFDTAENIKFEDISK